MSQETRDAMVEAIRAHMADEIGSGAYLTDWYLIAAGAGADPDSTNYLYCNSDSPPHSWYGLLDMALRRAHHYWEDGE